MKKLLTFSLALVLMLSICVPAFASEVSTNEDTVHYGQSEISTVTKVPYNIVEVPDGDDVVTADEDIVYYGINELPCSFCVVFSGIVFLLSVLDFGYKKRIFLLFRGNVLISWAGRQPAQTVFRFCR